MCKSCATSAAVPTSSRCRASSDAPACQRQAQVKERQVVLYGDLPVYGTPMSLAWKNHRMRCVDPTCAVRTWVLEDHRIAAENCLLTTSAAKWATVQVGGGRTVSEVAAELACDWHTVNDAVTTYGKALLEADRKRLNKTTAIGLDETSFVKLGSHSHTAYATTVADAENHQIIDILPTRNYTDVAGWIHKQPAAWKERIRFGALANRCLDAVRRRVQNEQTGHRGRSDDPPDGFCSEVRRGSMPRPPSACGHCSSSAIPVPRWPSPTGSRSAYATSTEPATPTRPADCSKSSKHTASDGPCPPRPSIT
jgi:Helix-turn-helix domain of transposase family ISL3